MTIITQKNFKFHQIPQPNKKDFLSVKFFDLSAFHAQALRWIGDALRPPKSEWFWNEGCYCWYTENQTHEFRVWMTTNGIAMWEDVTAENIYVIEFVN